MGLRRAIFGVITVSAVVAGFLATAAPPAGATGSTWSINDVSVTEGDSGTTNATFTLTLTPAPPADRTISWAATSGTATLGTDFTDAGAPNTATVLSGQTTTTINVPVVGDTAHENDETFTVTLSSPSGGDTIADPTGTGTIVDDDPLASIDDPSGLESNGAMPFTVTLSSAPSSTVTIPYTTAPGTAHAGTDYVTQSGNVVFAPGDIEAPINVALVDDRVIEPNETFTVTLGTPSTGSATVTKAIGTGTIIDDDNTGYWLVARDGGVFTEGNAVFYGSEGGHKLNAPVVDMLASPGGRGYYLLGSDGGVFTKGDAVFYGSQGGNKLNKPIVGMAISPTQHGYYLVASDGGVFTEGDAVFHGSEGGKKLNSPIVGMTLSASGNGYYLVAADGGVFTEGDAVFHGSEGGQKLNKPIVGMALSSIGNGYYLVASDGGIFTKGDAVFHGSQGGNKLNSPIVGMTLDDTGNGYYLAASDGGVFAEGDAVFVGSQGGHKLNSPVVGIEISFGPQSG